MNVAHFLSRKITKSNHAELSNTVNSIAIGSVSIGILVVVLSIFILHGFKKAIHEKSFSFSGQLNVKKFTLKSNENNPVSYQSSFFKRQKEIAAISHIQGVAYKQGLLKNSSRKNKFSKNIGGILLKGIDKRWDTTRFTNNIIQGRLPRRIGTKNGAYELMISKKLAQQMQFNVGDKAVITFIQSPPRFRKMIVSGIYETGMEEFDDIALCSLELIQKLNDWNEYQVTHFEIFLKNFDEIDEVYHQLTSQTNFFDKDLYVTRITKQYENTFEWLKLLDRQVFMFIILILFIACFNIASTYMVLIMDNTNKIGILKSLGASNHLIRQVFIIGGVKILTIGMALGNVLALSLAWIQDYFKIVPLDYENYFMHYVPISWEWNFLFWVNIVMICLVLMVLLVPTNIIFNLQPVKALKFD